MAMRITDSITYANFLQRIQELNRDYHKYNEQVTTGKRINRPSDDPIAFSNVINLRNELVNLNQYIENINNANQRLEVTDSRLNDVSLGMTRMIQLNEQAANEPTAGEPRRGIAREVFSLTQEMLNHADANFNGRALFAGTRNTVESLKDITNNPDGSVYSVGAYSVTQGGAASGNFVVTFADETVINEHIYQVRVTNEAAGTIDYEIVDLDSNEAVVASGSAVAGDVINVDNMSFTYTGGATSGDTYTAVPTYVYNGTSDEINMQVSPNTTIVQNVYGTEVFGGTEPTGPVQNPGGTIFDDFVEFRRALLTDDQDAILTSLDTIYSDHDNLNRVRAEAGGRISHLRSLETRSEAESAELLIKIGETEGADLAKSISELVQSDSARQAALSAGARIGRLNLFDFLG